MRVLINCLSLTHGGGRSYILNLLRELARDSRGVEATVLAAEGQLSMEEARGIPVKTVRLPGRIPALRLTLRVLYEQLVLPFHALRHDLLFCVADMAPAVAWTPTVVILRNLNIYDRRFYDNLRLRSLYALTRLGLRRVHRAVFPTRAAADLIRERVSISDDRVAVVPYGIASGAFEDSDPVAADRPYLLIPAALERHKNLGVAIECLRHLEDPALELWLVGPCHTDPTYTAELHALAEKLGLEDRVCFVGPVPYRTMLAYYRGAAAFVLPSEIETFGHPILEAMLAGTPVVASDIPAFRELAGAAGLYFPVHDAEALARAIGEVLRDSSASARRCELGRERAARYTWGAYVDALVDVFRAALKRS